MVYGITSHSFIAVHRGRMNSSSNAVYVYNALVGLVGDVILNFVAGSNINTSYNNKRVDTVTDVTGRY